MDGTSRPPSYPVNAQSLFVSAPALDASGLGPPIMIHQTQGEADHPSDAACPISAKPFVIRVPTKRLRWTEVHESSRLLTVQSWFNRYPRLLTGLLTFVAVTALFSSFVSHHHHQDVSLSEALDPHTLAWVIKHARTGAGAPGLDKTVMRELADAIQQQDKLEAQKEAVRLATGRSLRRNVGLLGFGQPRDFDDAQDDDSSGYDDGSEGNDSAEDSSDDSTDATTSKPLASTNVGVTAIGMNHHLLDSDLGAVVDSSGLGSGSVARLVARAKMDDRSAGRRSDPNALAYIDYIDDIALPTIKRRSLDSAGSDQLQAATGPLNTAAESIGPVAGNLASMTSSLAGSMDSLGGSAGSSVAALAEARRDLPLDGLLGSDDLLGTGNLLGSLTDPLDTAAASIGPVAGNLASMTNSLSGASSNLGGSVANIAAPLSGVLGSSGSVSVLGKVLAPLSNALPIRDLPLANLLDLILGSDDVASSINVVTAPLKGLEGSLSTTLGGLVNLKRDLPDVPGGNVLNTLAASLGPVSGNAASMTNSLSGMTGNLGGSLSGAVAALSAPLGGAGTGLLRRSSVNRAIAAAKAERGLLGLPVVSPSFLLADLNRAVPDLANGLLMRKRDGGDTEADDSSSGTRNYPNPSAADSPGIACPDGYMTNPDVDADGNQTGPKCVPKDPSANASSSTIASATSSSSSVPTPSAAPSVVPSASPSMASGVPQSHNSMAARRSLTSAHKRSRSRRWL